MPAVWVAWSMITFFIAIISFIWTTGSSTDNPQAPSPRVDLAPRIIITAIFVLGLIYFCLVINTFKSYGEKRPHIDMSPHVGHIQLPEVRNTPTSAAVNALDLTGVENDGRQQRASMNSAKDGKNDLEKVTVLDDRGRRVSPRL